MSVYLVEIESTQDYRAWAFAVYAVVDQQCESMSVEQIACADGTVKPFNEIPQETFNEIMAEVLRQEWRRRTPKWLREKKA